MQDGILRQIEDEMRRAYRPREGKIGIQPPPTLQSSPDTLLELRSAIAALSSSYALVGQTPPEPPTLRGRIGARLVGLVQRLLFWYTPQIVHFQYSALRTFESALRALEGQAGSLQALQQQETETGQRLETGFRQIQQLETGLKQIQQLQAEHLHRLEVELRTETHDRQTAMTAAASSTEVIERRLEALQQQAFPRMDREVARLGSAQAALEDRIQREVSRLRAQQAVREERVARLIQTGIDSTDAPVSLAEPRSEAVHNIDALYAALEDEFRGSRDGIKELLSVYLPKLTAAGIGGEAMPILDVGCGRGEWLELLRENQLHAAGIDMNRVVLAICREHGLAVMEADAIEHLRSLPEASLGAVTAFHVIEHLELQPLLDLLDAIQRVLKPGGIAIFETPNPNNVFVSSRYFYLDPTHRHPIPPLLGRFLAEARGFEGVEILELHPWPAEHRVDVTTGGEVAARFNECFYGPQDYAIIGRKS